MKKPALLYQDGLSKGTDAGTVSSPHGIAKEPPEATNFT